MSPSAGTGAITATNPLNGDVFDIGVNSDTQSTSSPYNIEEYSPSGQIVTSFGDDGLVASNIGVPPAQAQPIAAAVQSDGKLIVVASFSPGEDLEEYYISRYTTTGAPDTSFNGVGTVLIGTGYSLDYGLPAQFALLPNGNFVLYGSTDSFVPMASITEYTSSGNLDLAFGNGGTATGIAGVFRGLTVDSSGDLIGLGAQYVSDLNPPSGGLMERFTPQGQLDTTFGNQGTVIAPDAAAFVTAQVTSTGIAVAGYQSDYSVFFPLTLHHYTLNGQVDATFGSGSGFISPTIHIVLNTTFLFQPNGDLLAFGQDTVGAQITRVLPDGSVDTTFGADGYDAVHGDVTSGASLEPDGQLVLPGADSSGTDFEPIRLASDGSVDPSFGVAGIPAGRAMFLTADSAAELPYGQTLVAGQVMIGDVSGVYIDRLNADGSVDNTFAPGQGYDGQDSYIFIQPAPGSRSYPAVNGLHVDSSGRIEIGEAGVGILRFASNGQIDITFGTNGTYANPQAGGFLLESNGEILVSAGVSTLLRLTASGQLDPAFGNGGTVTLPAGFNQSDGVLAVQSNGQILIGGTSLPLPSSTDLTVLRLNSNGSVDTSFGTGGLAIADHLPAEINSGGFRAEYTATPAGLAVLPNGNIVIAGTDGGSPGPDNEFAGPTLAEFLPTGAPNAAFGTDGQTITYAAAPGLFTQVGNLIVQSDGTLVVAGTQSQGLPPPSSSIFLLKYSPTGTVDSFVTTQVQTTNPAQIGDDNVEQDAVAGTDGTVVVTGYFTPAEQEDDRFVARYFTQQSYLTGTVIGTTGSYQNQGNTIAKVFDGNLSTYFDAPTASGSYVGLDLGSPAIITQISYAPRNQFAYRMIGGVFQASNSATFTTGNVNLYTITATPPEGVLTTVSVTNPTAYRYIRYVGSNNSYCNIAELQFVGNTPAPAVIGTAGSYQNQGNTIANVFDDNLSTFFDAPTASGSYVGLDLGTAKLITQISYAPRAGYTSRMIGGVFQASNSATFSSGNVTLFTITANPQAGILTTVTVNSLVGYRYVRYVGPANSYCNIAEMQVVSNAVPTVSEIGTAGSYNGLGNTLGNAFDGNLSTFFDAPTANGAWVGLNFGSAEAVTRVSFAPRSGFTSRMVGGEIQASSTADFSSGVVTAYTITKAPAAGVLTSVTFASVGAFQYWRYIGPTGGYCNISELEFSVF